jgi:ketosteroid isomerase-like protein
MSEENVEIAKGMNVLLNRGEIEAMLEFVAEDFVLTWSEPPPGMPRKVDGREAFRRFNAEWMQLFADWTRQVEEWIDAGEWVITVGSWGGTGKGSGARVAQGRDVSAYRFQRGKMVEGIMGLPDKKAALEAAGLSE